MADFGRFWWFLKWNPPKVVMTRQIFLCFSIRPLSQLQYQKIHFCLYIKSGRQWCHLLHNMRENGEKWGKVVIFHVLSTRWRHIFQMPKHNFLVKMDFYNFFFLISSIVKRFLFDERQIVRTKFYKIFWGDQNLGVAGNIQKKRRIYIFLGAVLYCIFLVLTQDVFYVFWGCRHAQGVKCSLKRHLRGQNGEKPLKMAVFACFRPFFEVFSLFLKNRSNDFY